MKEVAWFCNPLTLKSLRFRERYQPIKASLRKVRQTLPAEVKEPSERLYAFTNIVYYLIKVCSSTRVMVYKKHREIFHMPVSNFFPKIAI